MYMHTHLSLCTEFALYLRWLILRNSGETKTKTQQTETKIQSPVEKKITTGKRGREREIKNIKKIGRRMIVLRNTQ